MTDRKNYFSLLSHLEDQYADNAWWLQVYTIDEDEEHDYHMLEFANYDSMLRFKRMINNVQTPNTAQDTIFVGAYGPILEVEEN
jgi:hypothetical protein